jgi:leucyl-tRNA synthetase
VQINGQKETVISTDKDISQKEVEELAKNDPKISKLLVKKEVIKVIFIKNKLINFVV